MALQICPEILLKKQYYEESQRRSHSTLEQGKKPVVQ